jgi:hypothetical protein
MRIPEARSSPGSLFLKAAAIVAVVAAIRFFLKGWLDPIGVPTVVGSFLASITVVLIITMVLFFLREGRRATGRYLTAALWFAALAIWCQALIIAGILLTERTGKDTYYSGPWQAVHERFATPTAHVIGHAQAVVFVIVVGMILGAIIYYFAKRGRGAPTAEPAA